MSKNRQAKNFLKKRMNTIVALAVIVAVLIAGYFLLRDILVGEVADTTAPPAVELLPGESEFGKATLIYPRIDRKDLKSVTIKNPANAVYGDIYAKWGIAFGYDKDTGSSYGYMLVQNGDKMLLHDSLEIDDTQLTYFAVAAGQAIFSSRVEENCTDFSPYGLEEGKAVFVEIEKTDGSVYRLYVGKKNLSGTAYYVRSGDTYTDESGKTVNRNTVYLLQENTAKYYESVLLAKPTVMLTKRVTFPIADSFDSFQLIGFQKERVIRFEKIQSLNTVQTVFGGASMYYTKQPTGYFSSPEFEGLMPRFEDFQALETLEYATELISGVDEETGETYEFFGFSDEVLAKYGLDTDHAAHSLEYTAKVEGVSEALSSNVIFSDLHSDGYYYAYSLCYNTIVRITPQDVDFLEWDTIQFFDPYIIRMNIGYCETISVKGEGVDEIFRSDVDDEYIVQSAFAANAAHSVSLQYYRVFFQELYTTMLRGEVPEDSDSFNKKELMSQKPYLEIAVKTRNVTVYASENGIPTETPVGVIKGVTRYLRFYQYTNGRAMMTVETVESDGKTTGEIGGFYVLTGRLDKLASDTDKLIKGESFSFYEKE